MHTHTHRHTHTHTHTQTHTHTHTHTHTQTTMAGALVKVNMTIDRPFYDLTGAAPQEEAPAAPAQEEAPDAPAHEAAPVDVEQSLQQKIEEMRRQMKDYQRQLDQEKKRKRQAEASARKEKKKKAKDAFSSSPEWKEFLKLCEFFRNHGHKYDHRKDGDRSKRERITELLRQFVADNSTRTKMVDFFPVDRMSTFSFEKQRNVYHTEDEPCLPYVSIAIVYDAMKDFVAEDTRRRIDEHPNGKKWKCHEQHFIDSMKEVQTRLPFRIPGMKTCEWDDESDDDDESYHVFNHIHGWEEGFHTMGGGNIIEQGDYTRFEKAFAKHGLQFTWEEKCDFYMKFCLSKNR